MHIVHVDAGGAKVNEDCKKNTNKDKHDVLQEKDGAGDYERNCGDGGHKNDGFDDVQDGRNNNKSNYETRNNLREVSSESYINVFQVICASLTLLNKTECMTSLNNIVENHK